MGNRSELRRLIVGAVLLTVAVSVVFAPLLSHPFLELDDDSYVTRNPHVSTGLGWDNLTWAFTSFHSSNWHPLTWLSHQLDVGLFGLAPRGHHATSAFLHVTNTLLVLFVLHRMTGAFWPSFFVAGVFGLHPQRLESVAWVAERKDVLSGFFGLLTLASWTRYAEKPTRARYLACLLSFALALLAKPMMVTLPLVMLLLDVWPLRRARLAWEDLRPRLTELSPFLAMSLASCVVTILAQRASGSIGSLAAVPFTERLANALVAYVRYPIKAVWPVSLALVYPLPSSIPLWQWAGAAAILGAVTTASLAVAERRPWLTVGWLWYAGMLVPVIGLIQVGTQSYADRYTYFPMLGLDMALAWSAADLVASRPRWRAPVACAAVAVLAALGGLTIWQVRFWSSSERLFDRSLAVSPGSAVIHNNYGALLQRSGRPEEALAHFRAALAADPYYATARKNEGNVLLEMKRTDEAISELQRVVHDAPGYAAGQNRLGVALATAGRHDEAFPHLRKAVELEPADPRWREDLVVALLIDHKEAEAVPILDAALARADATVEDRYLLGVARSQQRELDQAAAAFQSVLALDPKHARALNQLGIVRARQKRFDEAIDFFRRSLAIDPSSKDTEWNLKQAEALRGGAS